MKKHQLLKRLSHISEYLLLLPIYLILESLSRRHARAFGRWLFSMLGPLVPVVRVADYNLRVAFPELSRAERRATIRQAWGHLGQTLFDYVKLHTYNPVTDPEVVVHGEEHLARALDRQKRYGKATLFFTAHFGQWEMGTYYARRSGIKMAQVTRFINNPYLRKLVNRIHRRTVAKLIPKGAAGSREIIKVIREGWCVSMLADQKMDEGVATTWFGKQVRSAPALAKLAQKYDLEIIPFYTVRDATGTLYLTYEPPLNTQAPLQECVQEMNDRMQRWVSANPEQYFWFHKRYPRENYRLENGGAPEGRQRKDESASDEGRV